LGDVQLFASYLGRCKGLVVLLWTLYIFGQWLCLLDINLVFISIYSEEPYFTTLYTEQP